jgi:hypothetical protein
MCFSLISLYKSIDPWPEPILNQWAWFISVLKKFNKAIMHAKYLSSRLVVSYKETKMHFPVKVYTYLNRDIPGAGPTLI